MAKDTPISFVSINRAAREQALREQTREEEALQQQPSDISQVLNTFFAEPPKPQGAPPVRRNAPSYDVSDLHEKSFYAQVKDWLIDLCFEKPLPERPIGLSQLSRKTFLATEAIPVHSRSPLLSHQRMAQDYRFQQLVHRGR